MAEQVSKNSGEAARLQKLPWWTPSGFVTRKYYFERLSETSEYSDEAWGRLSSLLTLLYSYKNVYLVDNLFFELRKEKRPLKTTLDKRKKNLKDLIFSVVTGVVLISLCYLAATISLMLVLPALFVVLFVPPFFLLKLESDRETAQESARIRDKEANFSGVLLSDFVRDGPDSILSNVDIYEKLADFLKEKNLDPMQHQSRLKEIIWVYSLMKTIRESEVLKHFGQVHLGSFQGSTALVSSEDSLGQTQGGDFFDEENWYWRRYTETMDIAILTIPLRDLKDIEPDGVAQADGGKDSSSETDVGAEPTGDEDRNLDDDLGDGRSGGFSDDDPTIALGDDSAFDRPSAVPGQPQIHQPEMGALPQRFKL